MKLDPDKLRTFLAIVDHGSFAAAGRASGRATSVVSYAMAGLEEDLGVTLLDREGAKRPTLTAKGAALLPDIRRMVEQADQLSARAAGLRQGMEAELSLVVDVMFPMPQLTLILRDFAEAFPVVPLKLQVEAMGATAAALETGDADLAISGPLIGPSDGLARRWIGKVVLIPVAAPDHPLAGNPVPGATMQHLQLVLTDRSRRSEGQDFSVLSPSTWRLGDLSAKHALLREGVGWGNMPAHMVEADLHLGSLVRLALPESGDIAYPLYLLSRRNAASGPASQWLAERIAGCGGATASGSRP